MSAKRYIKVGYVLAEQATAPGKIDTPEGVMSYGDGDYLVTDAPPTHMWPVKRDIFERTYVEISAGPAKSAARELEEFGDVIRRSSLLGIGKQPDDLTRAGA